MSLSQELDRVVTCPDCDGRFEVTPAQWLSICKFDTYVVKCLTCESPLRWDYAQGCVVPVRAHVLNKHTRAVVRRQWQQVAYFNATGNCVVKCGFCGVETSAYGVTMNTGVFVKRWATTGKSLFTGETVEVINRESIPARPAVVCGDCASLHAPYAPAKLPSGVKQGESKHWAGYEYYRPTGIDGTNNDGAKDQRTVVAWEMHDAAQRKLTRTQVRREQRKVARQAKRDAAHLRVDTR
jgi:hypothetical protein